jgi:hypothetical protein
MSAPIPPEGDDWQEDGPPWEFGALRRDSLPHRAKFLNRIAYIAQTCNRLVVSVFCLWPLIPVLTGVAGVLGGLVWVLATHDLRQMSLGAVDRSGESETRTARDNGKSCVLVGGFVWAMVLVWGAMLMNSVLP